MIQDSIEFVTGQLPPQTVAHVTGVPWLQITSLIVGAVLQIVLHQKNKKKNALKRLHN